MIKKGRECKNLRLFFGCFRKMLYFCRTAKNSNHDETTKNHEVYH